MPSSGVHPRDQLPAPRPLSRRHFLALSASGLSLLAVAACAGPSAATPTAAPAPPKPTAPPAAPAPTAAAKPVASAAPTAAAASAPTTAAAAPTPAAAAKPASAVASEPVSLTFFHYAGSNQEIVPHDISTAYMQEFPNVKIDETQGSNASTFPAILAAYKATGKPTVQFGYFNPDASTKGDLEQLWVPLDPQRIPNMADIFEGYRRPNNMGIGWGLTPLGIAYNKDLVKPAPTSWLDLLDPKFKGRVGLPDGPLAFTFGGILAINRLMGGTEKNIDAGMKAFSDAAKAGQFHSVFPGNQALKDLMVRGDIWISGYSKGNVGPWEDEGAPVGYVVPKESQIAFPLFFQILKGGSPAQVYHAEQLINRLLAPEQISRFCELCGTAPASSKVKLPAKFTNDPAYAADNIKNSMQLDWTTVAEQNDTWLARLDKEIKANLS